MTSLAWEVARRILGLSSPAGSQPDWPDALTPNEIASLQYPLEGSAADKRKAQRNRRALVAAIKSAIDSGELVTTTRPLTVSITEERPDYVKAHRLKQHRREMGISTEWAQEISSLPTYHHKIGERTVEIQVVPCAAFAAWPPSQKAPCSEHIQAWIDTKPPEPAKRQRLRALLQRLDGHDPENMPGQKIDFHALAIAYYVKGFGFSSSTFSDYLDKPAALPKLCSFKQGAGRNPDYYRKAGKMMGVNTADYDSALKKLENQKASTKAKKGHGGT